MRAAERPARAAAFKKTHRGFRSMTKLQERYENDLETRARKMGYASYQDRFDRDATFQPQMRDQGGTRYAPPQKFLELGDYHPEKGQGKKGAGTGGPTGLPPGKGTGKKAYYRSNPWDTRGGGWGRPPPPDPPQPPAGKGRHLKGAGWEGWES